MIRIRRKTIFNFVRYAIRYRAISMNYSPSTTLHYKNMNRLLIALFFMATSQIAGAASTSTSLIPVKGVVVGAFERDSIVYTRIMFNSAVGPAECRSSTAVLPKAALGFNEPVFQDYKDQYSLFVIALTANQKVSMWLNGCTIAGSGSSKTYPIIKRVVLQP